MKLVAVLALTITVVFAPRDAAAQLRNVAEEAPVAVSASVRASAASAQQVWEEAMGSGVAVAATWSAIGRQLFSVGLYRESIAAFERSLVQRKGRSPDDARAIADAYEKIGNTKQAARWRALAVAMTLPSRRRIGASV